MHYSEKITHKKAQSCIRETSLVKTSSMCRSGEEDIEIKTNGFVLRSFQHGWSAFNDSFTSKCELNTSNCTSKRRGTTSK